MKLSEVEYKILRQEMQNLTERKWKLDMMLFSFCGIIFAYLFSQDHVDSLGFLIPIPVIFLFVYLRYNISKHIWSLASFCVVYGKENGFFWENRLYISRKTIGMLNKIYSKKGLKFDSSNIIALVLSCICVILYLYKNKTIIGLILSLLLIAVIVSLLYFRTFFGIRHYAEIFDEEIKKWEAVKAKEKEEMDTLNLK
ncbi:hypothetical protein [Desulfovibrio piger]